MRNWRLAMKYIATGLSRITAITMSRSDDCVICKLISGEIEVSMVYQDNLCSAFLDHRPVNTGHTLIVPNRHVSDLAKLRDDEMERIFRVAQRIAAALPKDGVRCGGTIRLKNGKAAGQDVFHSHLRVIPRYVGDGMSKMESYRFVAECLNHVVKLSEKMSGKPHKIGFFNAEQRSINTADEQGLPYIFAVIDTDLSLSELRDVMNSVVDGHVMAETVELI